MEIAVAGDGEVARGKKRCAYCTLTCCCACTVVLLSLLALCVVLPCMIVYGPVVFRSIGALYGPGVATSITKPFARDEVEAMYYSRFWLGQSAIVVGERNSTPSSWLVANRGHMIKPDQKMRIYSASKMVSAAVIYAVVDDARTSLASNSTPGDLFAWWRCDGVSVPNDARCSSALTLEKMLALRAGLPSPGCENGRPPAGTTASDAWEECARMLHGLSGSHWAAETFDKFEYGTVGLFLAGRMAVEARRQIAGHEADEWPDLLHEYILLPAGITPAPTWTSAFDNGDFAYDYSGDDDRGTATPEFPGLGGSVGCSPMQLATFAHALLSGRILSTRALAEMTRSHGTTDGFGSGMPFLSGYAQGMWHGAHSQPSRNPRAHCCATLTWSLVRVSGSYRP